nr:hypothetical protein Iba_chr08bCG12930 [Ipomoea batatas]GMD25845.1 hypothetical protein Iba_chr08cCG14020 [Ipomoea batatas]
MASKNDDSNKVFSVSQTATLQKKLIRAEWQGLLLDYQIASKCVQRVIRLFTLYLTCKFSDLLRSKVVPSFLQCFSDL